MPDHMDMRGANNDPMSVMPPEAREALMQADEEIGAVLVARLANMSAEELRLLDSAITPEVARVLMKLLPELRQVIDAVESEQPRQNPRAQSMGALQGM
tara:strand:+ start:1190 stop:1486 length:297 start_codon:yes stop_codon:yes gene_type:complete